MYVYLLGLPNKTVLSTKYITHNYCSFIMSNQKNDKNLLLPQNTLIN